MRIVKMAALGTTGAVVPTTTDVDSVFASVPYIGSAASQSLTSDISNFSSSGGLFWARYRTGSPTDQNWGVWDTIRGTAARLLTSSTNAQVGTSTLTSFDSSGVTLPSSVLNETSIAYSGWLMRRAQKFLDIVTYAGTGTSQTVAHNLGAVPGMIIIKSYDTSATNWAVYHRGASGELLLNTSAIQQGSFTQITAVTSTGFTVSAAGNVNGSGNNYVAYVFGHDSTASGLLQCGIFTTDASGNATVTSLPWEPQFLISKCATTAENWFVNDTGRLWTFPGNPIASNEFISPTTTTTASTASTTTILPNGFKIANSQASATYVYMAIRRSNRVVTSGTQVYQGVTRTGTGAAATVSYGGLNAADLIMSKARSSSSLLWAWTDRARGPKLELSSPSSLAEATPAQDIISFNPTGYSIGTGASGQLNGNGSTYIDEVLKRTLGVFEITPSVGTGANATFVHNLGVAPELWIAKDRTGSNAWTVGSAYIGASQYLALSNSNAVANDATMWNATYPTASNFSVGTNANTNTLNDNLVFYSFATKAGISKVGTYTGNGSTQAINCGFSAGARLVMIKRVDATGDWFIVDTARGITSGNTPTLLLDSNSAEVNTAISVTPSASGFTVVQNATTALNVGASVGSFATQALGFASDNTVAFGAGLFVTVNDSGAGRYSVDGVTWTAMTTPPASKTWDTIIYGASGFVAMPSDTTGSGSFSADGKTWSTISFSVTASAPECAYGNGMYLVVGMGTNQVATSTNGTTWTPHTASLTFTTKGYSNTCSLAFGAGLWVLTGTSNGHWYTSPDGITWTDRGVKFTRAVNTIFANGLFVTTEGGSPSANIIWTSPDGLTWTSRTMPSTATWTGIAYGAAGFVAVADNGGAFAAQSYDGITWTSVSTPGGSMRMLAYGNNKYFATQFSSSGLIASVTGAAVGSWVVRTATLPSAFQGLAYGNGTYVAMNGSTGNTSASSPDGITWTNRTLPASSSWTTVTFGNGKFVAVNTGTTAAYSPDGINWTNLASFWTASGGSPTVAYGNNQFLAVRSGNNEVSSSSDGVTWSHATANITLQAGNPSGLTYGNGIWVLVGNGATYYTSPDGLTWTSRTFPGTVTQWNSVAFGGGTFVVVGGITTQSGTNIALTSTDGINWTQRATLPASAVWWGLAYGNGYFMAAADVTGAGVATNIAAYSQDGISWVTDSMPANGRWRSLVAGQNQFVAGDTNNGAQAATVSTAGSQYLFLAIA